jgi:hypothetical protein
MVSKVTLPQTPRMKVKVIADCITQIAKSTKPPNVSNLPLACSAPSLMHASENPCSVNSQMQRLVVGI